MKNELRVGNWVKHNDNWCYRGEDVAEFQWEDRDWYAVGECTLFLENIKPIPLTEEWLIKLWFEKQMKDFYTFELNGYDLFYDGGVLAIYTHAERKPVFEKEVKYVHELQNAIYIACDIEITQRQ